MQNEVVCSGRSLKESGGQSQRLYLHTLAKDITKYNYTSIESIAPTKAALPQQTHFSSLHYAKTLALAQPNLPCPQFSFSQTLMSSSQDKSSMDLPQVGFSNDTRKSASISSTSSSSSSMPNEPPSPNFVVKRMFYCSITNSSCS
ncbi:hypothetical protein SDJN02_06304, partial [Cucurbita argyrosperma subsp. argyrosperma]